MAGPRSRRSSVQVRTRALVVRRVNVGEADVMLTLVTRERGLVSASARSARRTASKLGPLEPMHTLEVGLSFGASSEIARLADAKILTPRISLVDDPVRLETAARVLGWARSTVRTHSAEPRAFDVVEAFLDQLMVATPEQVDSLVVQVGLTLLAALGLGLELRACVSCGTPCPPRASSYVDPARGGLVCRACGGAREILPGATRQKLERAANGESEALDFAEVAVGLRLVEDAIAIACGSGATRQGAAQSGRSSRRT